MNKIIPINSDEKYLCCLCILKLIHYDDMSLSAKELFNTLTEEDKEEIRRKIENEKRN